MKLLATPLVCAVLVLAVAADDDPAKVDLDKLQGPWKLTALENDGKKLPEDAVKAMRLSFKGDRLVLKEENKEEEGVYKLDPTKKPKAMDLAVKIGDKTDTVRLIYDLTGDDLKLCGGKAGKDRPTEFAAKTGSGLILMILKREKE